MGKLHKSLTYTLWAVFLFLLFQFVYYFHYYKDLPRLKKEIAHMRIEVQETEAKISELKQKLKQKQINVKGEEYARAVYMMHKKDEKLYKFLDI